MAIPALLRHECTTTKPVCRTSGRVLGAELRDEEAHMFGETRVGRTRVGVAFDARAAGAPTFAVRTHKAVMGTGQSYADAVYPAPPATFDHWILNQKNLLLEGVYYSGPALQEVIYSNMRLCLCLSGFNYVISAPSTLVQVGLKYASAIKKVKLERIYWIVTYRYVQRV